MIIAIDGPAGAGKSTVARGLAAQLGYMYVDSGAMYRAVALWAVRNSVALDDDAALGQAAGKLRLEFRGALPGQRLWVDGEDVEDTIRTPEISEAAAQVASLPSVRQKLVEAQRQLAANVSSDGGVVMEGRDIGSVVFPQAELKIFLTASLAERARRRLEELRRRGEPVDSSQVRLEVEERDHRDRTRAHSPLVRAPDAVDLITDGMTPEQALERVVQLARERGA